MAIQILAATIDALPSQPFTCDGVHPVTVVMYAEDGLIVGAEYGDLQISHDGGWKFQDLLIDDGSGTETGVRIRLHGGIVAITVTGPGVYRVDKEVTSNAASISTSSNTSL